MEACVPAARLCRADTPFPLASRCLPSWESTFHGAPSFRALWGMRAGRGGRERVMVTSGRPGCRDPSAGILDAGQPDPGFNLPESLGFLCASLYLCQARLLSSSSVC